MVCVPKVLLRVEISSRTFWYFDYLKQGYLNVIYIKVSGPSLSTKCRLRKLYQPD